MGPCEQIELPFSPSAVQRTSADSRSRPAPAPAPATCLAPAPAPADSPAVLFARQRVLFARQRTALGLCTVQRGVSALPPARRTMADVSTLTSPSGHGGRSVKFEKNKTLVLCRIHQPNVKRNLIALCVLCFAARVRRQLNLTRCSVSVARGRRAAHAQTRTRARGAGAPGEL